MQAVLEGLNSATFMQLYLDQFFTAEVGRPSTTARLLFAGNATPEEAAAAITAAAGG